MDIVRRTLLGGMALAAIATATPALAQSDGMPPATEIKLWPGSPPGGGGTRGPEHVGREGAGLGSVSNISVPRMEIYRPAHPNGTAVLIMGGGGYFRIQIAKEANPAARWLLALGATPVVLYYRLPDDGWSASAPFQDAQRAMRILRARAAEFGIDPDQIGVMGLSAGGHLAAITETRFADQFYQPIDAIDRQSSRPDFAALVYPVITMKAPFGTSRSKREVVGDTTDPARTSAYSPEDHVTARTPPTFLVCAADDPIVAPDHSLIMFGALRTAKVPAELHVFERGGHGFGLGSPGTLVSAWPRLFTAWAKSHGMLGAPAPARSAAEQARDDAASEQN